jgi:ubiquinone/menaquinone biosynthesis C-methylase UbiE
MTHSSHEDRITSADQADDNAHFSRWASTYEDSAVQKYLDRIHDALLAAVGTQTPAHVLDVGCGTGRLLRKAAARWPGAPLTGVDPAEGMIAVAQRLTPAATFRVADAGALPLPSASVDLVLSSVSLHHWPDPGRGLAEIARVLRPAGQLGLADITLPGWMARLFGSQAKSKEGLRRLCAQAGLVVHHERALFAGAVRVLVTSQAQTAT